VVVVVVAVACRTVTSSSSAATVDDDVGATVKHVRTYQVYRGMSPEAVSRLEVSYTTAHAQFTPHHSTKQFYQMPGGRCKSSIAAHASL